jgi:hypothetical protein
MVVGVFVDAVTPGVLPPVASEQSFEQCGRIGGTRYPDRTAVENECEIRVIGNEAVIREPKHIRLSASQCFVDLSARWPHPTGNLLYLLFDALNERHCGIPLNSVFPMPL